MSQIDNGLISAVMVVGQRADNLTELTRNYAEALAKANVPYELVVVLDGPKAAALEQLQEARRRGLNLKIVRLSRAFGEATALMSGFDHARGGIILTLPAYFQVAADQIPMMIESLGDSDMLIARREPRRGSAFEHKRRETFHWLIGAISGVRFNDLGCGVRVIRRRVLDELRLYGDQHRFLAVLAANAGFSVREIPVTQSEKDYFESGYRIREYLHRLLDIVTIFFLTRFTKKPLRFFGMIGGAVAVVGGLILALLVFQRMFMGIALADRPAMLLSALFLVLGLQLFSLGLLGELIIFTHARSMREYKIAQIISSENDDDAGPGESERSVA